MTRVALLTGIAAGRAQVHQLLLVAVLAFAFLTGEAVGAVADDAVLLHVICCRACRRLLGMAGVAACRWSEEVRIVALGVAIEAFAVFLARRGAVQPAVAAITLLDVWLDGEGVRAVAGIALHMAAGDILPVAPGGGVGLQVASEARAIRPGEPEPPRINLNLIMAVTALVVRLRQPRREIRKAPFMTAVALPAGRHQ